MGRGGFSGRFDENEQRKNFNPSEKVAISEAIYLHAQQKAKERPRAHSQTAPGKPKNTSENFTEVIVPQPPSRDIAAAAVGWSGPTYAKARKVVKAAEEDPEFQPLVEEMDRTGNISRAYNQLPSSLRESESQSDPAVKPKRQRTLSYEARMQR
jgi:ParB family chromosome partitioning protein